MSYDLYYYFMFVKITFCESIVKRRFYYNDLCLRFFFSSNLLLIIFSMITPAIHTGWFFQIQG